MSLDVNDVRKVVIDYWKRQKKQKAYDEQTKKLKSVFNSVMKEYFESLNYSGNNIVFENEYANCTKENQLRVNKVQKSKVFFFPEKVKQVVGKKLSKRVIDKKYEIIDYRGLVEYLKELDADPKIFKQFISVEETVNEEALNYLLDVGAINELQLKCCYKVEMSEPYFTVREVGAKDWELQEPW